MIVLQQGKLVLAGAIGELTGGEERRFVLEASGDRSRLSSMLEAAGHAPRELPGGDWSVRFAEGIEDADGLFELAARSGFVITGLREERSTLEQVFMAGLVPGDST